MSDLIYIEYISRRPGVGLHEFHTVVSGGQTGWAGGYADDVAVLSVGRSWRMGPEPEYLQVWYTRDAGLERIDFWEETFRSGDADAFEEPFRLAARIDRAGCYDPLVEPVIGSRGRYYAEWFEPTEGATAEDLAASLRGRTERQPECELNLACLRIGHLGPDPRGLAVWGLERWADAEGIARAGTAPGDPLRVVAASLYADFGSEQL